MPHDTAIIGPKALTCLSEDRHLLSSLRDITPFELGQTTNHLRSFFASLGFAEVLLNPFTDYPIDYLGRPIDVPGVGQLRFNTEPEIWAASETADRFYSISCLFRNEKVLSPLRRSAFFVIDFYQYGPPESLLPVFWKIIEQLAKADFAKRLSQLRVDEAQYDPSIDAPNCADHTSRWVVATGYGQEHSFFEVDERGISTRKEVFLVTPRGHLEIGVFGITGSNKNPDYLIREGQFATPDFRRSGMCFGLERLLLAEQILSMQEVLHR